MGYYKEMYCPECRLKLYQGKCRCGFKTYAAANKDIGKKNLNKSLLIEKKCYYCGSIENLELDILPDGRRVYFCPWHFQRNYYSLVSKRYPQEAKKKHFIKALANLVSKRKEERRAASE